MLIFLCVSAAVLGEGKFAQVKTAKHRKTGMLYAAKIIAKDKCKKSDEVLITADCNKKSLPAIALHFFSHFWNSLFSLTHANSLSENRFEKSFEEFTCNRNPSLELAQLCCSCASSYLDPKSSTIGKGQNSHETSSLAKCVVFQTDHYSVCFSLAC